MTFEEYKHEAAAMRNANADKREQAPKQTGGAAFPRPWSHGLVQGSVREWEAAPGMTLRDWFAGMAMQGYLANTDVLPVMAHEADKAGIDLRNFTAKLAYKHADAMLKAREGC